MTSSTASRARGLAALAAAAALALFACAAGAVRKPPADPPPPASGDPLAPLEARLAEEGAHNRVLNEMRLGLAALDLGDRDRAAAAFDRALAGIETVYANNEQAARARSLWYEEGSKDFKGEPYERAMAYYYRGLLYLMKGDFENARASFKGGVLQDAFAEEEQHRCDFALLIFLEGWASQCAGDRQLADAAYEELARLRPDFPRPGADANALVLLETGKSPRKLADGVGHAELVYRRGKQFTEARAAARLDDRTERAYPMEDVFWQAATRGGRPVDRILQGKVVFQQRGIQAGNVLTDAASSAAMLSGAFGDASPYVAGAAAALGLAGAVSYAVAVKAKPQADTRYWDNLPDAVHVAVLSLPLERQEFQAEFFDAGGKVLPALTRGGVIEFPDNRCGVGWVRSQSALPNP